MFTSLFKQYMHVLCTILVRNQFPNESFPLDIISGNASLWVNALWLAFFHNQTTVRLRPDKHLHEHGEAAHLGEHLSLVGQRLLTAINTLSMWKRDHDGCLNRSVVTALRTLQITCFGELDVRDYATTEKIWEPEVIETLWMETSLHIFWSFGQYFLFFGGAVVLELEHAWESS